CLGYDADEAPCAVHQGKSTTPGSAHYKITQTEADTAEDQVGEAGGSKKDGSLTPQGTSNCVNATSQIAVQGGDADKNKPGSAKEQQRLAAIREKSAASLAGKQGAGQKGKSGSASDAAKAKGSKGKGTKPKAGSKGLTADQKKAIECMEEFWKKAAE